MRRLPFPNREHYVPGSLCLVNSKLFLTNLAVNGCLIDLDLETVQHSKMLHNSPISTPHGHGLYDLLFQTSRVARSSIFTSPLAAESQTLNCVNAITLVSSMKPLYLGTQQFSSLYDAFGVHSNNKHMMHFKQLKTASSSTEGAKPMSGSCLSLHLTRL